MDNLNNSVRRSIHPERVDDAGHDEEALRKELSEIRSENERLRQELENRGVDSQKGGLPTKEEIESISAMLDLVNKLDENMINKIQKLSKANISNADNS